MLGALSRLVRHEAANVATLFALVSPLLIGAAAFAVDEAALHIERRQLQAVADLAAIHAAIEPARARERVLDVLADANYSLPEGAIAIQTGRYSATGALSPGQRFVAGAEPANAVRVGLRSTGRVYFASVFGFGPPDIAVRATASATPRAAYSIGSRLASLNGGVVNKVLGGLLGTELSFSLLDYNALAAIDVDLLGFLDALAGEVGITAGTYSDLLDARVALADIAAALSSASGGNALFLQLAGLIDDSIAVDMARLIAADGIAHLGVGTSAALEAGVNALNLLSAAALVADGHRQVTLALGADLPGLLEIGVALVVGEPPQGGWFTFAGEGSFVRTAQVRLRLDVVVAGSGGGLGLLSIRLPVYVELAPPTRRSPASPARRGGRRRAGPPSTPRPACCAWPSAIPRPMPSSIPNSPSRCRGCLW